MRYHGLVLALCLVPAALAASFFDHFTGSSLDARWVAVTSGGGTVAPIDSAAQMTSPAAGDAAFIHHQSKVDTGRSQLWLFAINPVASSQNSIFLMNRTTPPAPAANAVIDPMLRVVVGVETIGAGPAMVFSYFDTSHRRIDWNTSSAAWTSFTPKAALSPVHFDNTYVVGFEIDADAGRWRLHGWVQDSPGGYTFLQGLLHIALTDWVSWSALEPASDLWVVVGDPYTDRFNQTTRLEWARLDDGEKRDGWTNGLNAPGNPYDIRRVWGFVGANGGVEVVVPEDRTTVALPRGPSGSWDDGTVKDSWVVQDGWSYYMVYSGKPANGRTEIGIASATSTAGPWIKAPGNPIVRRQPNTNENAVVSPALIKDLGDPDPNKRWKIFYTGVDPSTNMRIYMRTCPGPPDICTWSASTLVVDKGNIPNFNLSGYTAARPMFASNTWYLILSARDLTQPGSPARISWASGPSLTSLTPSSSVLGDIQQNTCVGLLTSNASGTRTLQMTTTAGCTEDMYVEIDQNASGSDYGQNRVRSVDSPTQVTLYHRWDGWTVSNNAKVRGLGSMTRLAATDVVQVGPNEYWMYVTHFAYYATDGSAYGAHDENTGLMKSTTGLVGTYSFDYLNTPVAARHNFGFLRSNENLKFVHQPIASGTQPTALVNPTSVNFGHHAVGTQSPPQTIGVTNGGSVALNISTTAITTGDVTQFQITSDACSGTAVAPAGSCAVDVRFAPTAAQVSSATLRINSNAPDTPHLVPLTGDASSGPPVVTVVQPNGGEQIAIGSTYSIQWTATDDEPISALTFGVELSVDGGASYAPVSGCTGLAGATSCNWTVGGPTTSTALVRVTGTDSGGGAGSDTSNGVFSIVSSSGSITVTQPTTAVNWGYGTQHKIKWTTTLGSSELVRVLLSTDGGATFPITLANNVGATKNTVKVTMPALASPTTTARVRVEHTSNTAVQGTSPVNFTVEPAFVRVTEPNGPAHVWAIGTTRTIRWANNVGALHKVKIELSLDGGQTFPVVLYPGTPSDGSQSIVVQSAWTTQRGRVRITWTQNGAVTDVSDQDFPIQ